MKQTLSFAVLCLIGAIQAVSIHTDINANQSEQANTEAYTEATRYIGANGQPISLAQTEGHARMTLTRVEKYDTPQPLDILNLQTEACDGKEAKETSDKTSSNLNQGGALVDDVTHCPINGNGPVEAHMKQINLGDNAYVSEFYVGNPPQKLRGLFDTGSTNTWVLNKAVNLGQGVEKAFSYDDGASTSSKKLTQKAAIQFGSGALAGHFMTDDLRLGTCDGTTSSGQIHIKNQKFGNVEKQKTIFTGSNFEAIIGMAYPALAEKGVTPVFDEMINQKLLKTNVFAFYFTSKQAEGAGMNSDLTFGYYDKSKFKGDVEWHPVLYKYMFGVKLDDVKVNGKSLNMCHDKSEGCMITFDSGTSLMSFPTWAAQKMMQNKLPTANFVVPCKSQADFGDMALVINGKDYVLSNEEWMFPSQQIQMAQGAQHIKYSMGPVGPQLMVQVDSNVMADMDMFKPKEETTIQVDTEADKFKLKSRKGHGSGEPVTACASTVMAMDISKEMFLVGDVFMRKFYTIFDRENDRIGLAQAITSDKH